MTTVGDIAAELGVAESELAYLEDVSADERHALLGVIHAAALQRDRELREAVDGALGFVPKPLRGRVVKLLRGGR